MSIVSERPVADGAFDIEKGWQLHPQVALRDESFGARAYHYGTRRLHFLKSRLLVQLVTALPDYDNASSALAAVVPEAERPQDARALARLAATGVIDAR